MGLLTVWSNAASATPPPPPAPAAEPAGAAPSRPPMIALPAVRRAQVQIGPQFSLHVRARVIGDSDEDVLALLDGPG